MEWKNIGKLENATCISSDCENEQTIQNGKKLFDNTSCSFTLESDKQLNVEELFKILGIDISKKPDSYTIQYPKFVQMRKHKKKRINKKWIKRYGYKQIWVNSKGWKLKCHSDGTVEFVK